MLSGGLRDVVFGHISLSRRNLIEGSLSKFNDQNQLVKVFMDSVARKMLYREATIDDVENSSNWMNLLG